MNQIERQKINLINFEKIFYDVFLLFHINFLFYIIEELKIINKLNKLKSEIEFTYKFEKFLALLIEILYVL